MGKNILFRILKRQQGQVLVEYILLMVMMMAVSHYILTTLSKNKALQEFLHRPWAMMNGMIQCGAWKPCGVEVRKPDIHANTSSRVLSLDPKGL